MKIRIYYNINNGRYIPKKRFLFWWYDVTEFGGFQTLYACQQWLRRHYCPNVFKSRSSTFLSKYELFEFYPERRDEIDIDFN
jgi:hypothetical protein